MVLESQLPHKRSTYCFLLLIKILSWRFCGGVDFLKLIDKYIICSKTNSQILIDEYRCTRCDRSCRSSSTRSRTPPSSSTQVSSPFFLLRTPGLEYTVYSYILYTNLFTLCSYIDSVYEFAYSIFAYTVYEVAKRFVRIQYVGCIRSDPKAALRLTRSVLQHSF